MIILSSGGNGRFCNELLRINDVKYSHTIFALSKDEMNVSSLDEIEDAIDRHDPDIFIHAGAITSPMIQHENSPNLSIISNIIGTANVTIACMKKNIKLIYLSTDYVYPGDTGNYKESDPINPVNKYAWSKLGGECSVLMYDNSLVLRLSMTPRPFSHDSAIVDSYKSSIYIDDAAEICFKLLDQSGIINVGGQSQSIYEFAKASNKNIGKIYLKDINSINMAKNSTMNLEKLEGILKDD